ncbi:MAG: hypothetical protein NTU79_12350 [Planctomycetota bacterium]|nr:hypothetical protein [Planctomycetota bacterium]
MNRAERAAQLWPLLAWAATNRQTLTYDIVARLTGLLRPSLGGFLEPIQSYCLVNNLPPLTVIVVSTVDGRPGTGNIQSDNPLEAFISVFAHNWLETLAPSADVLAEAVIRVPTNATIAR